MLRYAEVDFVLIPKQGRVPVNIFGICLLFIGLNVPFWGPTAWKSSKDAFCFAPFFGPRQSIEGSVDIPVAPSEDHCGHLHVRSADLG